MPASFRACRMSTRGRAGERSSVMPSRWPSNARLSGNQAPQPGLGSAGLPARAAAEEEKGELTARPASSHLFDFRPAEQALRQKNQRNDQDGKGRDVLIID